MQLPVILLMLSGSCICQPSSHKCLIVQTVCNCHFLLCQHKVCETGAVGRVTSCLASRPWCVLSDRHVFHFYGELLDPHVNPRPPGVWAIGMKGCLIVFMHIVFCLCRLCFALVDYNTYRGRLEGVLVVDDVW